MKKTIKQVGNSLGIIFNKEECKIYNFKKEDIIELDDTVLIKEHKGEKGCYVYFNLPKDVKKFYENESKRLGLSQEEVLKKVLLGDAK